MALLSQQPAQGQIICGLLRLEADGLAVVVGCLCVQSLLLQHIGQDFMPFHLPGLQLDSLPQMLSGLAPFLQCGLALPQMEVIDGLDGVQPHRLTEVEESPLELRPLLIELSQSIVPRSILRVPGQGPPPGGDGLFNNSLLRQKQGGLAMIERMVGLQASRVLVGN